MRFASTLSTPPEAAALIHNLRQQLEGRPAHLLVLFLSRLELDAAQALADEVRAALAPEVMLACTAEGVIGAEAEVEQRPAVSALAAHLPGVTLAPFEVRASQWPALLADAPALPHALGLPADSQAVLLLADPFSTPMEAVLEAFNTALPGVPLLGGCASGASRPGYNLLIGPAHSLNGGAVGVALAGALTVEVVVSQGCRPVGAPFTVTAAEDNLIHSLEYQSPVEQIQTMYTTLPPEDQRLLQNGLFIGRAVRAAAPGETLGRGDFLVRGVLGVERQTGALAVGDVIRTGETIQFQVRDAETAREDLELLLVPHTFGEPPAGLLLFSCNGRGTRLFEEPDGDIRIVTNALGVQPLAGFFCAGELGAVAGQNFLHSHTASLALIRPAAA